MWSFLGHGVDVAIEAGTERGIALRAHRGREVDAIAPHDGAGEAHAVEGRLPEDVRAFGHVPGEGRPLAVADAAGVRAAEGGPGSGMPSRRRIERRRSLGPRGGLRGVGGGPAPTEGGLARALLHSRPRDLAPQPPNCTQASALSFARKRSLPMGTRIQASPWALCAVSRPSRISTFRRDPSSPVYSPARRRSASAAAATSGSGFGSLRSRRVTMAEAPASRAAARVWSRSGAGRGPRARTARANASSFCLTASSRADSGSAAPFSTSRRAISPWLLCRDQLSGVAP